MLTNCHKEMNIALCDVFGPNLRMCMYFDTMFSLAVSQGYEKRDSAYTLSASVMVVTPTLPMYTCLLVQQKISCCQWLHMICCGLQ